MVSEKLGRERLQEIPQHRRMLQRQEVGQFQRTMVFLEDNFECQLLRFLEYSLEGVQGRVSYAFRNLKVP